MPRRDTDSELDFHRAFVEHLRNEGRWADAQETYDNCWKLREWRDRLQEPGGRNNTMDDCFRWVRDSMQIGTWEESFTTIFFRMVGRDIPPRLRQHLLQDMRLQTAARIICMDRGQNWFTNQELRAWKPRLDGIYYDHPGRHFIDDIPGG